MKTNRYQIPIGLIAVALLPALASQAQVNVSKISAGADHSLFVKSDGSLWGTGFNYFGQLGDGTSNSVIFVPERIMSNGVTAVVARGNHSFFQTGGGLWAMGDNQAGGLGDGTTNNIYLPKQIATGITIGGGDYHTLFTRSSGIFRDLEVMGDNQLGELGDGTTNNTSLPERILHDNTLIIGAAPVTAVDGGFYHSLFLKGDGSLWAMGYTADGQLGDGHTVSFDGIFWTNLPEKIVSSGVTAIAAGSYDSYFIKNDGSLWGMGDNSSGQLGVTNVPSSGVNTLTNRPVMILPNNVLAVSANDGFCLVLKTNGSLWTMGYNGTGQLGDGTFNNTNQPELIVAGGVTAISAGGTHSLFLESDGTLWGMGQAGSGQLAGYTTASQPLPVQVVGPLVGNGGFESDDFMGWVRSGPSVDVFVLTNTVSAHSGFAAAEIGTVGTLTRLTQTLNTLPGTNYLVSFWLKSDGSTPSEFVARWNGFVLIDQPGFLAGPWFKLEYTVKATSTSTVLDFGFRDDPGFIGFDDVSVVPLIQPTLTGITLAGTNLVLSAANGQWNGTYATLMGTNLAQPFFSWTPLATNILDGDGNFTITVTNGVNPTAPQRFYALQLQ